MAASSSLASSGEAGPAAASALYALPLGARAVVESLGAPGQAGDDELLLRLIEIGFLPGESVRVVARAGPGPMAVRLGGQSTFALREREARLIRVRAVAGTDDEPA